MSCSVHSKQSSNSLEKIIKISRLACSALRLLWNHQAYLVSSNSRVRVMSFLPVSQTMALPHRDLSVNQDFVGVMDLSSSILGKISSANIFAHELSSAFFSRAVSENTLSLKDICWLLFTLNDINLTTLQIYNHYNTIDLGVVRLAAYSIFRNFLYF